MPGTPQTNPSIDRNEHDYGADAKKVTQWYIDPVTGNAVRVSATSPLPSGSPALALRLDDTTTTNVTYVGKAAIASATSAAVWQIQKIDETTGMIITWADGDSSFNNIWDNRASLTYV